MFSNATYAFYGPLTDQWSVDVEDEHDGREPDVRDEPSLGSLTHDISPSAVGEGARPA